MVIEAVAEPLARQDQRRPSPIPTIGIGASAACDGQVLVLEDMLGLSPRAPKFVRRYWQSRPRDRSCDQGLLPPTCRSRNFPGPEHVYGDENKTLREPRHGLVAHLRFRTMRLEARFGDRLVPAFAERPNSIWAMIAEAAAQEIRWRGAGLRRQAAEVARGGGAIRAGHRRRPCRNLACVPGDRVAVLLGNRVEFVLTMFAAAHAGLVTGAARRPPAEAGDRLCADRLRRQAF